jgi:ATP-dependent DNA helicase RecG
MIPSYIALDELARRESEQTEWKENVADPDDVVATLVAFANDLQNLGGGTVVCGAREDKDAQGFPILVRQGLTATRLKEVEGIVLTRCRERVSPPITPLVEERPAEEKDRRILLFIQPRTGGAHTFRRGQEGAKHFVRVGRSTIEARNGVLRDLLVRTGAMPPWDQRICGAATTHDLDKVALRDALERMGVRDVGDGIDRYLTPGERISPFVPSLCVEEPMTGIVRPRNYAVLLFARDPQQYLLGAVAIYSAYPGQDRTDPVARRLEMAGTLLEQARRLKEQLDSEAVTIFDKRDLETPNVQKYPARALMEAMVNALAHRDYELMDPTRITSYSDRIEFLSPGSLPFGVKIADLQSGVITPRWRNQSLAWFLNRLQLAQAEGQGIMTIRRSMKVNGSPPPRFEASEVWVRCILEAHSRAAALGQTPRVVATSKTDASVRASKGARRPPPRKKGQRS